MSLHWACKEEDLWIGDMKGVVIGDLPILVVRLRSGITAYVDKCPHLGSRLSRGEVIGEMVTCPLHEWQFDLSSGRGVNPASACLQVVPVSISDGNVFVSVSVRSTGRVDAHG